MDTKPMLLITHLYDYTDCETCGGSGAEGFRVELDGKVLLELLPAASCLNPRSYTEKDLLGSLLEALAVNVELVFAPEPVSAYGSGPFDEDDDEG